jgi:exodeoxyribonuclease VII small subunit
MKATPKEESGNEVPTDQLNFEAAFKQLETIVAALESEEKPLEEALALFERGQVLARHCIQLLDRAELRVRQLSGTTLADFEPESGGS